MKRSVQVNVKMSPEDFQLLKKAADKKWPDAVMTNSASVVRSKAANGGQVKTGQRMWPGT